MKRGWKVTLGILLVIVVLIGGLLLVVGGQARHLAALDYAAFLPSGLKDGSYFGQASTWLTSAEVALDIQDGKLTDIRLIRHFYGRGRPAEAILDSILSAQRLDVDSVSGATVSSLTLKAAVWNALTKEGSSNE